MSFYKVNTTKLQIREGFGTNYADIGDLWLGDIIETAEIMGGWHRIVKIKRVNSDIYIDPPNLANSWCSAAYTVEIANPNPEPEPIPTVKPLTVTITGEDYQTIIVTLNPK